MRNIRLTISYDGTRYSGWQTQANAITVQEVIEAALKKVTGRRAKLKGAGRTDSGVHARYQVANFRTASKIPLENLKTALNSCLAKDILINSAEEAAPSFDSQKCARSKHYRYAVTTAQFVDPFLRHFVSRFSYPLDMAAMRKAAARLKGRHNFRAFQASGSKEGDTVRAIKNIKIEKRGELVYINILADGFLYNMARTICGTLLEIGRGKLPVSVIDKILKNRARHLCGPTAPARGLCLMKVEY